MTDTTDTPGFDRIEPVDIQTEMQRSYIDYAMSVIVGRALPDVRDGLKPVHRKILYGMYDSGFRPDRNYVKCGRVVGDVMGNYHPHGDSALYDALVRMAQPWSLRYPLIDPQGNFGSPGNDPAAAYRYTECRLQQLAMAMLQDIDEETVDFVPNYAGNTTEPVILPARFPNLLVNGSEGIAVGMATRIPPHNLREVAAGVTYALDHPDATRRGAAREADRARSPARTSRPASLIVGRDGIEDAYRTGRGSIRMRAVVEVEEDAKGATILVVTELPYQVNPDNLVESIAALVKDGKLGRHPGDPQRELRPHRHAHRHHAQPRRGGQGRAQQPVQAHPAADDLRRQHAGHRRRRAAHAAPRPVRQPLRRAPDRGARAAHALPAAQGRGARAHPARAAQGARPARRGDRADPQRAVGRRRPRRADAAARDRRAAGHGHPRPAAAPAGRAGAQPHHRGSGRDRGQDRRSERHPGQARAGSGRSSATR